MAVVLGARLRNRRRRPPGDASPGSSPGAGHEAQLDAQLDRASSGPALVAVLLAVVPLSFSGDFIQAASEATESELPPWTIYAVDGALLLLILVMILRLRHRSPRLGSARSGIAWWFVGAALMLGTDALDRLSRDERPLSFDLATASLWLVSIAVLLATTLGASPPALLRGDEAAWLRFRPALPLIAGTTAAFLAGILWVRELDAGAVRTVDDALARAEDLQLIQPGARGPTAYAAAHELCAGAVSQEYFAQLSQIIPLLLVAVGVEAGFFGNLIREAAPRATTITTILILCLGEALAVSALPEPNQNNCRDLLYGWHEYVAFIATIEACSVALATLVWALLRQSARGPSRTPP